ncbi:MAG: HDIG domain-containing protein [Actinomycetota bacterium]|nr:HDIG domain-containing protein [Actinomycetota bacterium]
MASISDLIARVVSKDSALRQPIAARLALAVLVIAGAAVPLVIQTPPVGLFEGSPASRTYRANRTVQFVDEEATDAAGRQAVDSVQPVYVFDNEVLTTARGDVAAFFDAVSSARQTHSTDITATLSALTPQIEMYDEATVITATSIDATSLAGAERAAEQLVTTVLSRRITEDQLEESKAQMLESASSLPFSTSMREMIATVIENSLNPTVVLDPVATQAARDAASAEVAPIVIIKQAGENIVQKGEIVTADHLEIVRRLGQLEQGGSVGSLAALVLLAALLILAAGAYLWRYDREVYDRMKNLALIATLFVGMIWVTRLVLWFVPEWSLYVFPVPLAAMLATLLISAREGMLMAILTSLAGVLLGFSSGGSVVAMLVWSIAAVVAMAFMTDRRQLFYVGAFLVTSGAVIAFTTTLASGVETRAALDAGVYGIAGGLASAVLGYGLLPFFEHIFGVTTDIRLLELGNPGHPLLRRLMVEAPGTYSHSVMTANLAESAAEDIGANPLLARVGAYYHDVGKIRRPGFFVENQSEGINPHDNTAPSLSALIITAHVKEGLELAREHKLPEELTQIIEQHHGNSLVSYFYNKAKEADDGANEADFRYPGSRPQSREAALVMLADSCEAAVRALKKPLHPKVEATVRKIVDGKVGDGQLNDAELTLADIETIMKVYSKILVSMYHPRIEYPDQIK